MMPRLLLFAICLALLTAGCRSSCPDGSCQITSCQSGLCQPAGGLFDRLKYCGTGRLSLPRIPQFWSKSRHCSPGGYESSSALAIGRFCPRLDTFALKCHARSSSHKALRELKRMTGERYSSHFRNGFEQAFLDIANGYSGNVPAVPPRKYWTAYYRTPPGRERANQWFEGYQLGVEQATQNGFDQLNGIATSAFAGPVQSEISTGLLSEVGAGPIPISADQWQFPSGGPAAQPVIPNYAAPGVGGWRGNSGQPMPNNGMVW